jgi:hypothetical protein
MLKLSVTGLMTVTLVVLLALAALPAATDTQTITYQVAAINELTVSGSPEPLIINTANAGSEPISVTDASTTYAITTNGGNNSRKITAQLDSDMRDGLTLCITLLGPTGADTPPTDVILTTTPANVVTCINSVAQNGLTITYTLSAAATVGVVNQAIKTVILIITSS